MRNFEQINKQHEVLIVKKRVEIAANFLHKLIGIIVHLLNELLSCCNCPQNREIYLMSVTWKINLHCSTDYLIIHAKVKVISNQILQLFHLLKDNMAVQQNEKTQTSFSCLLLAQLNQNMHLTQENFPIKVSRKSAAASIVPR